jgi:hypothetical protein
MLTYKYTMAAGSAVLAVTVIAGWNQNGLKVVPEIARTQQSHKAAAGCNAEVAHLPARLANEGRAAPIEPLPPQF